MSGLTRTLTGVIGFFVNNSIRNNDNNVSPGKFSEAVEPIFKSKLMKKANV